MSDDIHLSPEILIPRLGDTLVSRGLISEAQLQQALDFQKTQKAEGRSVLLGQAVIELGFLTRPELDRAITEQIILLRTALEDANRNLEKRVEMRTAELQEALSRLSELNQLKTNFISNVSHELRTPLTHIKGYLELLGTGTLGPLTDAQKNALQVSMHSASRLQNLIDDLIMFSLSTRGELTLQKKPTRLQSLAAEAMSVAQPKAQDRKQALTCEIDESLPPAIVDEQKMGWVLSQLLDNAIKFTPEGGQVRLIIEREAGNRNMARIAVQDTGIGIPQNRLDEIFEPFHQLDGASTRRYGGTGLGLTLVRQIIEAHGTVLSAVSEPGQGSTFSFPILLEG
ncbi:MAG: ATP-binding protein [Anaerolineales bacterium]